MILRCKRELYNSTCRTPSSTAAAAPSWHETKPNRKTIEEPKLVHSSDTRVFTICLAVFYILDSCFRIHTQYIYIYWITWSGAHWNDAFLVWICDFPTIGSTRPIGAHFNRFMTLLIIWFHISHLPFALSSVLLHFMVCFVLSLMLLDYVVVDRNSAFSESLQRHCSSRKKIPQSKLALSSVECRGTLSESFRGMFGRWMSLKGSTLDSF